MVLSGDDALTLPLMAVGGRGIISVASNEIPAEMVQMVEAAERNDFAAARAIHARILPLMQINFVEANPIPVKAAMAAMGLLEEIYRLPMVPAAAASRRRRSCKVLKDLDLLKGASATSRTSVDARASVDSAAQSTMTLRTRSRHWPRPAPRPIATPRARRSRSCAKRSPPATCAPPSPTRRAPSGWRVNTWVKQGILLGFRFGDMVDASMDHGRWPFYDKDTLPLKKPGLAAGVRIVPGGSAVRDGAYLAPGVICMPPMYVNIGAWVGEESMIDSHALVGSCAQVGARVHVSAAAQIGGVIEPVGALPVIVEDDVLIGGNTGIYEGAIVKARAVDRRRHGPDRFHAGLRSRPRRDHQADRRPAARHPGRRGRRARRARGRQRGRAEWGLSLATPVIVKYRDSRTDTRTELEAWIRCVRRVDSSPHARSSTSIPRPGEKAKPGVAGRLPARPRLFRHRASRSTICASTSSRPSAAPAGRLLDALRLCAAVFPEPHRRRSAVRPRRLRREGDPGRAGGRRGRLRREGETRVGLLFVVGEERGSDGAKIANAAADGCRFLIDGEPTDNRLGLATRGILRLKAAARGPRGALVVSRSSASRRSTS